MKLYFYFLDTNGRNPKGLYVKECEAKENSIVVDVMCAMFKNLNIKQGDGNETLQAN